MSFKRGSTPLEDRIASRKTLHGQEVGFRALGLSQMGLGRDEGTQNKRP